MKQPNDRSITTLEAVSSTLLIPLIARARGATIYPWLDPGDVQAQQVVERFGDDIDPLLQDRTVMLNVLWRTRLMKRLAEDFFNTIRLHKASIWGRVCQIIFNGSTTVTTAGWMRIWKGL